MSVTGVAVVGFAMVLAVVLSLAEEDSVPWRVAAAIVQVGIPVAVVIFLIALWAEAGS